MEPLGQRDLKGLNGEIEVRRVVSAERPAGRPINVAAPYVGREEELELLRNVFARVVRDRRAQLVTIFGEPGIGKSRLAQEFYAGLERTSVLTGRSLPFGEGIAYRPLAEMVQAAAGISEDDSPEEAIEKLREACTSDAVADLLGLASGVLDTVSGPRRGQEIAWAAHEWATSFAEAQPLVLGFEDVHWSEEPLLDLIEHLADRIDDAPVLIVCLARPELLDARPGWGGGRRRARVAQTWRTSFGRESRARSTVASSSAAGTTWCSRPISRASGASMTSAPVNSRRAWRGPMAAIT